MFIGTALKITLPDMKKPITARMAIPRRQSAGPCPEQNCPRLHSYQCSWSLPVLRSSLPRQWARFIEQCYLIGYTTLPIVAILSFFIGTVLALEAGYSMENFGAKDFIGSLVGLSMARELGPMMTAVLLAGRVGSAIAAELASMKVYQEIDALTTMNIPAAKILVLPRLAAVLVMMPVLIVISNMVGWSAARSSPATSRRSGSARSRISRRCATTRGSRTS